jgi:hypothetical protein
MTVASTNQDRDRDLPAVGVDVNRRIASGQSQMSSSFDLKSALGLTYRALAPAMDGGQPSIRPWRHCRATDIGVVASSAVVCFMGNLDLNRCIGRSKP